MQVLHEPDVEVNRALNVVSAERLIEEDTATEEALCELSQVVAGSAPPATECRQVFTGNAVVGELELHHLVQQEPTGGPGASEVDDVVAAEKAGLAEDGF